MNATSKAFRKKEATQPELGRREENACFFRRETWVPAPRQRTLGLITLPNPLRRQPTPACSVRLVRATAQEEEAQTGKISAQGNVVETKCSRVGDVGL